MTLRNEIFDALAAAKATKDLISGNPQDDYYNARAEQVREQMKIDKADRDEMIKNRQQAQRGTGSMGRLVPVASSTNTPGTSQSPVGYQTMDSGQQGFNPNAPPTDTSVRGDLPNVQLRKGGAVRKPKKVRKRKRRAIATGYRAGGVVTPRSDDDDEEGDSEPEQNDDAPPRMEGGPRHPKPPRRGDPSIIREPFDPDQEWEGSWEGAPEDDPEWEAGSPRHPRHFRSGGSIERGLPRQGSRNIEDRRNEPPPEQGEGDDDRVEPTEAEKQEQLDAIEKARRDGTLKNYTTKDFERRPVGPQDDFDIEPRRIQRFERGGSPESYSVPPGRGDSAEGGEIAAQARAEEETEQDALVKEAIAARAGDAYLSTRNARVPTRKELLDDRATGEDTDDAMLTAGNAREPDRDDAYLSTGNAPESTTTEDPAGRFRKPKPNIGPARALETSAPPADAKYPKSAPDPVPDPAHPGKTLSVVQPESSAGAWWNRFGTAHPESRLPEETGTEAAADERWRKDIMQRRADATIGPTEQVTPEQRERSEEELAKIREEEKLGPPSARLRARRRAIDTGTPASEFIDKENQGVGPVLDWMRQTPAGRFVHNINQPRPRPGAAAAAQAPTPATPADQKVDPNAPDVGEDRKTNMLYPRPPAAAAPAAPPEPPQGAASVRSADELDTQPPSGFGTKPVAPPPVSRSTTANGPNQGGGSTGPGTGAGAQPAPPGSLSDQNRIKAFNPETERGIGAVDASGRDVRGISTGPPPVPGAGPRLGQPGGRADLPYDPRGSNQNLSTGYANEDIHQTLAGARDLMAIDSNGKPMLGEGHVSRPVFQQYVQTHNQGGQLTPGDAMLRGMLSDYRTLLKQGRIEQANKMAYGLVQAANLEAAAHGDVAVDQMRRGDQSGAAASIVKGVDYLPDGMKHTLSPDGRFMITSDPRTGKVTGQLPIDGRWVLAAAAGLRDGTLLWNTLNAAASKLGGDKDPAGRSLSHAIKQAQLEGLNIRNRNAANKGAGRGGPAAPPTPAELRLRALTGLGTGIPVASGAQPTVDPSEIAYNNTLDQNPDQTQAGGG